MKKIINIVNNLNITLVNHNINSTELLLKRDTNKFKMFPSIKIYGLLFASMVKYIRRFDCNLSLINRAEKSKETLKKENGKRKKKKGTDKSIDNKPLGFAIHHHHLFISTLDAFKKPSLGSRDGRIFFVFFVSNFSQFSAEPHKTLQNPSPNSPSPPTQTAICSSEIGSLFKHQETQCSCRERYRGHFLRGGKEIVRGQHSAYRHQWRAPENRRRARRRREDRGLFVFVSVILLNDICVCT